MDRSAHSTYTQDLSFDDAEQSWEVGSSAPKPCTNLDEFTASRAPSRTNLFQMGLYAGGVAVVSLPIAAFAGGYVVTGFLLLGGIGIGAGLWSFGTYILDNTPPY